MAMAFPNSRAASSSHPRSASSMPRSLCRSACAERSRSCATGRSLLQCGRVPAVRLSARTLAAVAAAALLALGAFLGFRALAPGPSDEDRIRDQVYEVARAAEEKRVSDVMGVVSERFHGQELDRDGLRRLVAFHALRGSWNAVVPLAVTVEVRGGA